MASDRTPAYVPGFEHDVFISYACVDDQPEFGVQGWVSTFYDLLKNRLARLLGRPDCFSLWRDRSRLDGTTLLSTGIERPLKSTAVMVALLSNGYLASPWCPWEREVFLKAIGPEAGDCLRVFVVELDSLDAGQRPKEFADRLAYRFWVPGPHDKHARLLGAPGTAPDPEYISRMDDLARELVKVLKRMKERAPRDGAIPAQNTDAKVPPARPAPEKPTTTIYLAEATDDLESLWWKVKGYLEQQQIEVVPKQYLPRDPDAFRQAVVSNLADADLFVQLLSKVPGRRMDESRTYLAFQHACAREADLPVLQWRDPGLTEKDLAEVEPAAHRELLDGPAVQAVNVEDFKQEILRTLERLRAEREREARLAERRREAAEGKTNDKFVFIVADTKDRAVARSIFEYVGRLGYFCGLPLALEDSAGEITPADVRQDFEENVRLADGAVIVYGQTPVVWYRNQLMAVRKIHAQYQQDGKRCRVGLYVAPPPKEVGMKPPGVHHIPAAGAGIDEHALQSFLDALQEGETAKVG
jgi:hypothetical protein